MPVGIAAGEPATLIQWPRPLLWQPVANHVRFIRLTTIWRLVQTIRTGHAQRGQCDDGLVGVPASTATAASDKALPDIVWCTNVLQPLVSLRAWQYWDSVVKRVGKM